MVSLRKEDIFDIVKKRICEVLPDVDVRKIGPDVQLINLGANSVDRAEITVLAMESLSIKAPSREFSGVSNIGELVDVLYAKSQAL